MKDEANPGSPEGESTTESSATWKALADPTRRTILDLLRDGPLTTGALAERFEMSRYGVMKHLRVLEEASLVLVRRHGRERFNHLNAVPIRRIYRRWIQPFAEAPADALLRLQRLAEHPGDRTMPDAAEATPFRALEIHQEIHIAASPETVWTSLVEETVAWWPKDFYVGQAPVRFVVEPKVGGRVFEDWGAGDGGLWATVTLCRQDEVLQWAGDLSADFGGPARSITTFRLSKDGDGTLLRFHDSPWGCLSEGTLQSLESGWTFLLEQCFLPWVERGQHPERPATVEAAVRAGITTDGDPAEHGG
ncbi:MAG: metalloregulator ArsR/SmtB family transcription factor [Holophagales bacterium]|nr:metalloregulator ArsR/SmtB family transcription factor [Holophagales bacterium]